MKLPSLLSHKPASDVKEDSSNTPAVSQSQSTSLSDLDKEKAAALSPTLSRENKHSDTDGDGKIIETTPIEEAEALDKLSDEPEYPSGAKLGIIVASLCLSVFLMALDNTIIATAIPKITDHFKAIDDVGWYGSGT